MKMKRIISILCLVSTFTEFVPVNFANAASKKVEISQDINSSKLFVNKETDLMSENNSLNSDVTSSVFEDGILNNKLTGNVDFNVNEDNKGKIEGFRKIRIYAGEEYDYKTNISATDSEGNDITDSVSVEGEVDTSTPGEYKLMYSASDESGETYTFERYVTVVEKNEFNIFTESIDEESYEKIRKSLFSISLDNETSKFTVYNQSSEPIQPDKEDEVVFKMRVLDSDNKEKLSLELQGKDTGNSEKFDALKELKYSYGDFLEINPMEFMSEGFNIEGPVFGDVKEEDEDYSDGVDNADYISNVRFKIEEDGIYSVYNKAPEITGLEPMESLLTERSRQLEGVSVTDDHDEIISNDDITIYEEKDREGNTIGLRYEASDSWGRTVSVVRYLKSEMQSLNESQDVNYIDSNGDINLMSDDSELYSENDVRTANSSQNISKNVLTVKGFTYNNGSDIRFKMKFNADTKKIEIYERDSRLFDNKMTDKYFEISLFNKSGALKKRLTINGSDRGDNKKIDDFNNTAFEFGDQIHIYHAYSAEKLLIGGSIEGANFEYNNGVPKENLESARFELTENGFKYLLNRAPEIKWSNQNLVVTRGKDADLLSDITVEDDIDKNIKKSTVSVSGFNPNRLGPQTITYSVKDSWGAIGTAERTITVVSDGALANTLINVKNADGSQKVFSIGFDDVDKKLLITNNSDVELDPSNANNTVFTIKIISKAGITRKELKLAGSATGNSPAVLSLNNYKYTVGDYIELWSPNYEKNFNIEGNILQDADIKEDYSKGIKNEDFIKNVRFKIDSDVLFAVYNKAPTIVFEENLTIKRGETFNPLDFVNKIEDDHDNLNKNLIKTSYDEYEFDEVGRHKVIYTITDKWGRNTEETRYITVLEKNELEKNRIYFLNQNVYDTTTSSAIFILSFDDLENRLDAEIKGNDFVSGQGNAKAFEISIFNSQGKPKASSTIRYNEQIDANALSAILEEEIEHGDMINFYAYDYKKVIIEGSVFDKSKNNLGENGYKFTEQDKIVNTRFKVTADGLEEIYNNAPQIIGATDTSVMKNSEFKPLDGITVEDDHDKNISVNDIDVIGEINTSIAGYQSITYRLTDSWGRTREVIRQVFVKPLAENNRIVLKNSEGQDAFKLGFDFNTMKFKIESTTSSSVRLDTAHDEKVFSLTVRKPNGEVVETLELNGNDTGDSHKITEFKERTNLMIGSQLSIWAKNSRNLRVEGHIIKPDDVPEDYNDGIQEKEYMDNVRFVGTPDGMQVIYNKAPEVTVPVDTNPPYVLYKGDDYRVKLLEGVSVTDPNQDTFDAGIGTKDIKIKLKKVISGGNTSGSSQEQQPSTISGEGSSEDNSGENSTETESDSDGGINSEEPSTPSSPDSENGSSDSNTENSDRFIELDKLNELDLYDVYYTAVDSWGRESETKTRRISFKTSIDRNTISFPGYNNSTKKDYEAFKLGFDSETMSFKILARVNDIIHSGNREFFRIKLFNENDRLKKELVLNASDRGTSDKIDTFIRELQFAYGDYFTIYAYQSKRVIIDGPVRNEIEDYRNGVDMSDDFKYTRFYITEAGLESRLVPDGMGPYDSLIEFLGTNGGVPFKMKFNHEDRSVTYPSTNEFFNYNDNNIRNVLRLNINRNGTLRTFHFDGNDTNVKNEVRRIFGDTNRGSFTDGDYLNFEYLNIPAHIIGLRIQGKISEENKNYTEKLLSRDDAKNVRFYLRSNEQQKYLDPVYNYAPTFATVINGQEVDGLQDLNIYEDQVEAYRNLEKLKEDVIVKDDIDTNKNVKEFNVSGPTKNGSNTTLNGVGKYVYTYTARDSWGREARVTRNVYVRPNVYKNKITLYPKEASTGSDEIVGEDSSAGIDSNSSEIEESDDDSEVGSGDGENDEEDGEITPIPEANKPAFEIVLDNDTHRYVVKNKSDKPINEALGNKPAFAITIYNGQNNNVRKSIELTGLDTGESETLNELNKVEFQYGDTIRVWAADAQSLRIDGQIDKNISDETEDLPHNDDERNFTAVNYAAGTDNQNYYKNVAFKTSESKLTAYYNKAPKIKIENLKENKQLDILFGTTVNLRNGVTIIDDRDINNSLMSRLEITGDDNITSNEIGSHDVVYTVTDTWGRSTSIDVTVNIVSNMRDNQINVYNENNLKFGLKLNISTNRFEIVKNGSSQDRNDTTIENAPDSGTEEASSLLRSAAENENSQPEGDLGESSQPGDSENNVGAPEEPSNPDNSGGTGNQQPDEPQEPAKDVEVRITVTNRNGDKKGEVSLSKEELNNTDNLEPLTKINIFNDDIVSFYAKGQNDIRITGNIINNTDNHDFSQGFGTLNYDDVKFKITNQGFDLMKHRELEIQFSGDLTINRGDKSALFQNLEVRYKDNLQVESLLNIQTEVTNVDIFEVGVYEAEYIVTDVWGRKIRASRTVTVAERNNLERNRIVLRDINNTDSNSNKLMEFYIDTINNRIITKRFKENNYTGNKDEEKTLIQLTLYDDAGRTKDSIEVTPQNLDNLKDRSISYDDGDLIGLSVYDYSKGFYIDGDIQGTIKNSKPNYKNGAASQDHVDNVRFKIIDENQGVKAIYNNAPVITIDRDLTIFKDEAPDLYSGVKVSDNDEHDKDVGLADIVIETNVDITTIGEYEAKYTIQDTWGRNAEATRKIIVKSSLMNNKIEFYRENDKKNSVFDISINLNDRKFVVKKNSQVLRQIRREAARTSNSNNSTTSGGATVTTPGMAVVNPNKPIEGMEYQFKLFDENGALKNTLSITTDDMLNGKVNSLLEEFNDTKFEFGDYISVYAKPDENNVRITGNIDILNSIDEDYSDGIDNLDYMYNVRFKINEDAMDAVYNEAPTLRLLNPDKVMEVFCGDDHDYGAETEISDDHDLDIGSDNITISEEDKENMAKLGTHTITLILTDSWGRSVSVDRTYNVISSIDRNIISFPGRESNRDGIAFKVGFNSKEKKIKLIDRNHITMQQHENQLFFKINVYNSKNVKKMNEIVLYSYHRGTDERLNPLHDLEFDYGDYITIYAFQTGRVAIEGPVRDQLEDYTDGVQLGDDLKYTRFYITPAGLRSEFVPDTLNKNESLIEFIGTNGGTPFKIKFNHETRRVEFPETSEFYNYDANNRVVFRVKYYDASVSNTNGTRGNLTTYESRGGDHRVNQDLQNYLQRNPFEDGDYIAFEYVDIPDKFYGLRITGAVEYEDDADEDLVNEDYSDGIQNKRNLTEVRFYLNKDGKKAIVPVRVPAPVIKGAEDIDVLQGESFNIKKDVIAMDADGVTVLTPRMTVTGDNNLTRSVDRDGNLNTSRIGLYYVKYEVKNDAGITTTVYRNIRVYTNAEITIQLGQGEEYINMELGAYATTEAQVQYLKPYGRAQQIEGDVRTDISDRITVDVSRLNTEETGKYPVVYSVINDFGKLSKLEVNVYVTRTISVTVQQNIPFQVVTNLLDKEADPFVSGIMKIQNNRTSDVRVSVESFSKEGNKGGLEIVAPEEYNDWNDLTEEESMTKMALGMFIKSGFKEYADAPDSGEGPGTDDSNPGDDSGNDSGGDDESGDSSEDGDSSDSNEDNTEEDTGDEASRVSSDETDEEEAGDGADNGTSEGSEAEPDTGETENKNNLTWLIPNKTQPKFMGTLPRAESLNTPSEGRLSFTSRHGKNFIGGTSTGRFRLVFKFE
ncbi:immunoglobulin-like domain-containing protein [uncultured Clostridium sp.]|uniref:immunoglobulin-like domain-containing protein n=1 Tax=uncultured Clostridium sp. TaxID=59620 RepID=UPI0025FC68B2|nr:immunoglobulin-like domain-containing protein [uncultured Clostridium sp.]